jgi:hypothetical protein
MLYRLNHLKVHRSWSKKTIQYQVALSKLKGCQFMSLWLELRYTYIQYTYVLTKIEFASYLMIKLDVIESCLPKTCLLKNINSLFNSLLLMLITIGTEPSETLDVPSVSNICHIVELRWMMSWLGFVYNSVFW